MQDFVNVEERNVRFFKRHQSRIFMKIERNTRLRWFVEKI
jgi:hypothetical protein